jgi:hypothetical protein
MNSIKRLNEFIESRLAGLPPEFFRRARLLHYSLVISIVFTVFYIGVSFFTGFVAARFTMYASLIVFCSLLYFFSKANWKFFAHFFVGFVWILTLVLIYFSGDALSGMTPWLLVTPLMAILFLSKKEQYAWLIITLVTLVTFQFLPKTNSAWVYQSPWPEYYNATLLLGLVCMVFFITTTFQSQQNRLLKFVELQNDELRASEEELRQSMEALSTTQEVLNQQTILISSRQRKTQNFLNKLIDLAMCRGILVGDRTIAFEEILSTTALSLETSRVSIWSYNETDQCIECIALYDNGKMVFNSGLKLFQKDFPAYFDAILNEKVINAVDARKHPATKGFLESYLQPMDIYSMLDAPYTENGKFKGVIRCEQQGTVKRWDQEEVLFVNSISDLISMAINSSQRKDFEKEILNQREQILYQNNELTRYAKEIDVINQSLEARVAERTATLNQQNKQLTEYAFVNAHLLRGPLSRILGLIEIIRLSKNQDDLLSLVNMLDASTKELDGVVHKITSILHEGRPLNRNSL